MFKKLYLPKFIVELFLEEKLLAITVNISSIDPPGQGYIQKCTVFIGLIPTLVDSKQLEMLGEKVSGKLEGLFTVQRIMIYQENLRF